MKFDKIYKDTLTGLKVRAQHKFESRNEFWQDKVIFWNTLISIIFIIALLLYIWTKVKPGSSPIPLHYNVLLGVDVVGKGWYIYGLPVLAALILAYNLYLAKTLYKLEHFASYILVIAASVASAIFFGSLLALGNLL